jgi:hypothetical protein
MIVFVSGTGCAGWLAGWRTLFDPVEQEEEEEEEEASLNSR